MEPCLSRVNLACRPSFSHGLVPWVLGPLELCLPSFVSLLVVRQFASQHFVCGSIFSHGLVSRVLAPLEPFGIKTVFHRMRSRGELGHSDETARASCLSLNSQGVFHFSHAAFIASMTLSLIMFFLHESFFICNADSISANPSELLEPKCIGLSVLGHGPAMSMSTNKKD